LGCFVYTVPTSPMFLRKWLFIWCRQNRWIIWQHHSFFIQMFCHPVDKALPQPLTVDTWYKLLISIVTSGVFFFLKSWILNFLNSYPLLFWITNYSDNIEYLITYCQCAVTGEIHIIYINMHKYTCIYRTLDFLISRMNLIMLIGLYVNNWRWHWSINK
jgi:hypothetical protein